jgi:cyclase
MRRPRIIPVLLLKGQGLVKSVRFKDHKYIGDPLNAARIFNELRADELIFLDIEASKKKRLIPLEFVRALAEELTMPFSVGGGIASIENIGALIASGVEKVIIGTHAAHRPEFIKQASDEFGSSTISVCIDVKKDIFHRDRVRTLGGKNSTKFAPVEFAQLMEANGAGELIIQSVDRDGMMNGYDIELIRSVTGAVGVPVVAAGGAGCREDLAEAVEKGHANDVAAGSLFVYQSKQRGVLINYPSNKLSGDGPE